MLSFLHGKLITDINLYVFLLQCTFCGVPTNPLAPERQLTDIRPRVRRLALPTLAPQPTTSLSVLQPHLSQLTPPHTTHQPWLQGYYSAPRPPPSRHRTCSLRSSSARRARSPLPTITAASPRRPCLLHQSQRRRSRRSLGLLKRRTARNISAVSWEGKGGISRVSRPGRHWAWAEERDCAASCLSSGADASSSFFLSSRLCQSQRCQTLRSLRPASR